MSVNWKVYLRCLMFSLLHQMCPIHMSKLSESHESRFFRENHPTNLLDSVEGGGRDLVQIE